MPSRDDHVQQFIARLPEGEVWPRGTDGTWSYDELMRSLCGEAATVDTDALDFLAQFLPDLAVGLDPFITDWERLLGLDGTATDQHAAVVAKLRGNGQVNRPDLEIVLQGLGGSALIVLLHHLYPPFVAGAGVAGGSDWTDQWAATWICEYMPDVLDRAPDDAWDGSGVTPNFAQSPVTLAQTAQRKIFASDIISAYFTAVDDSDVYFSCWIRTLSGSGSVDLNFIGRDAVPTTPLTLALTSTWAKAYYRANVGSGGNTPLVQLAGTTETILLSWSNAGVVDETFETAARKLFPINQTGVFNVIGENNV